MNVYDFDNTIYHGESCIDFILYYFKKKKSLIRFLPYAIYALILYKLRLLPIDKLYKMANKMTELVISNKQEIKNYVLEFWSLNDKKLKPLFLEKLSQDDIIITAGPSFLIDGIKDKLKVKEIICSKFNIETGKCEFLCFKENKVDIFKELFPNAEIEDFYTDSFNDKPMMKLAKRSYLVKGYKAPKLIDTKKY